MPKLKKSRRKRWFLFCTGCVGSKTVDESDEKACLENDFSGNRDFSDPTKIKDKSDDSVNGLFHSIKSYCNGLSCIIDCSRHNIISDYSGGCCFAKMRYENSLLTLVCTDGFIAYSII